MNFNVDRIAQLAGLSGAGGSGAGALNESAGRRSRPATTFDRVVEELQVRGLEMFYSPEQINEAIRVESRLLREEREMERETEMAKMYEDDSDVPDLLERESMSAEDEGMYEDEGYGAADEGIEDMPQGTTIRTPQGTEMKITKGAPAGSKTSLAEAKLRKVITAEVDRVLAEMTNSGDTAWMYADRKRPTGRAKGATMGFAGVGFKR